MRADAGSTQFQVINGLLYRVAPPTRGTADGYQLIVPAKYRAELIKMAHDAPYSGHMGVRKSRERLESLYYWPRMNKMVAQYVRQCERCQKVAPRRKRDRAPLQPTEVMHTHPFSDISIDILVGQLPISTEENLSLIHI